MKILQINCVYKTGSTGIITAAIHRELLREGHESIVCYGRRDFYDEPHVYKTGSEMAGKVNHLIAKVSGMHYGGCRIQTNRLLKLIRQEKPDLVHLQCINGYFINIYRLVSWLKEARIPTVLTLHAEFMYTANCGYAIGCDRWQTGCGRCPRRRQAADSWFFDRTAASFRRMEEAFRNFEMLTVVGVSDWICARAGRSPILKDTRMITVYNGIDTDIFIPRDPAPVRESLGLGLQEQVVLFVTPAMDHTKGGDLFLELTEKMAGSGCRFLVAGAEVPEGYDGEVRFLGRVNGREELAQLYSAANVVLSCSRLDNYPTVCLEAAACGTPVIGFDTGGVPETVRNGLGAVVPVGDLDSMAAKIREFMRIPRKVWQDRALPLHESLSDRRMCRDYIALYQQILGKEVS